MLLTAGSIPDITARNAMVSQVYSYASANIALDPFQVYYQVSNASPAGVIGTPAQGAMFSLLAVK